MKQSKAGLFLGTTFLIVLWVWLIPGVYASESCKDWVAKVVSVQGTVEIRKADQTVWMSVGLNDLFCPGDMIRTQKQSRASVVLSNDAVLRLDHDLVAEDPAR